MINMTPSQIVDELDKHIIGQDDAKRAVAIALRNRHRRMQVEKSMRNEITPKNILMIGPTGVGKTEIARRLAKLANAPFIKVEATKFTEVGYVGRDVESIIRDLVDSSIKMTREEEIAKIEDQAIEAAEARILDKLLPEPKKSLLDSEQHQHEEYLQQRNDLLAELRSGALDADEIEIDITSSVIGVEIMAPPGMEEMTNQLQGLFQSLGSDKTKAKKMSVATARKLLKEEEAHKLVNDDEIKTQAITRVEQTGIVFLDELDKVAQRREHGGHDISREGVQRDLLPLVEGCTVSTRYGMVKTDHILFIASGAFHLSKPSDLIPELQGRLPIRVELKALQVQDFERILIEPDAALTKQYIALLATENLELSFSDNGINKIAEVAWQVNENTENIGARRLQTVMERLLEEISFAATDMAGQQVDIDAAYVDKHLKNLVHDEDLSRFIL